MQKEGRKEGKTARSVCLIGYYCIEHCSNANNKDSRFLARALFYPPREDLIEAGGGVGAVGTLIHVLSTVLSGRFRVRLQQLKAEKKFVSAGAFERARDYLLVVGALPPCAKEKKKKKSADYKGKAGDSQIQCSFQVPVALTAVKRAP